MKKQTLKGTYVRLMTNILLPRYINCSWKWTRKIYMLKNEGLNGQKKVYIMLDQWKKIWINGLKFSLKNNLTELFFYKMMYSWYLIPEKLSKMYKWRYLIFLYTTFCMCWNVINMKILFIIFSRHVRLPRNAGVRYVWLQKY